MRVAALVKPYNGCSFYRILLPLEYMSWSTDDSVKLFYPKGTFIREADTHIAGTVPEIDAFEPDIIFFNGSLQTEDLNWLQEKKAAGVKIVVDLDDYWEMSSVHPVHDLWYKQGHNLKIQEIIKLADVVFTATNSIAKKVEELNLNKNCLVMFNAVPFGQVHYKPDELYSGIRYLNKTNFLYAGGSTHYQDVLELKNKFDRIGGDKWIKDHALFTLAGFNPLKGSKHCQWDRMASIFKRTDSYQILDTKPVQEHMSFYDQADVVLVPLVYNEFNRHKSVLKIIEAATRELPCIVSKVEPYTELEHLPIMWGDWYNNIKFCLKNPEEIKAWGKKIAEYMKENYDIHTWASKRYNVFSKLTTK